MRDQPLPLSVMGKLPATSYVRMVDIWLIFTQLVPFIEETNFAISMQASDLRFSFYFLKRHASSHILTWAGMQG